MNHGDLLNKYEREFVATDYPKLVCMHSRIRCFFHEELHKIFSGLPESGVDRSLLEVGSGPTTYSVFPATRVIHDVVLSDYVPGNRREVEKWCEEAPDAIDWSFFSEFQAALEQYSDVKKGAEEVTRRTRSAIRKVISCDVLDPNVVSEDHRELFDVVLSCLCLESACMDETTYKTAMRNIGGLVRTGGLLILCGVNGCHKYTVGQVTFPCLPLTEDLVKDSLIQAGFKVKSWNILNIDNSMNESGELSSAFVVAAEKE